jgi:hypothetical protein
MLSRAVLTAAAIATAVISFASPAVRIAYADATDDQFIAALTSQGITGNRDAFIAQAHGLCDIFHRVQINKDMGAALQWQGLHQQILGEGLSEAQFQQFARATSNAYCPDAPP